MALVKLVTVYSPDGVAEKHTIPNAQDLTRHSGYTYDNKTPVNPASALPRALKPAVVSKVELAQEVLNGAGAASREGGESAIPVTEVAIEAPEPDIEVEEVEFTPTEEAPVAEAPKPVRGRRGREG